MKPLFLLYSTVFLLAEGTPFVERYFDQTIDHFRFYNKEFENATFPQRYLIQDKWWKKGDGPIFFYTGNEGPIDVFWKNSGFLFDIAPRFQALVVFAEHRFYGKSLPFDEKVCFSHPYVDVLTVEQALADYAVLLTSLKKELHATGPVISFGGSYGGMLSAYMRFKYPNIIAGGIAASAPIYLVAGLNDRNIFFQEVTQDFVLAGCKDDLQKAFSQLDSMVKIGPKGYQEVSKLFKLCSPLQNASDYRHLILWLRNAFTNIAMFDYPYPTQVLSKLPGSPVKVVCSLEKTAVSPVSWLADVGALFYGNASPCHNIQNEFVECADPTGCGLGPDSLAWDYQVCTEFILPAGSNNVTDMFPPVSFTLKERDQYCLKKWGILPRNNWLNVQMWGKDIESSSNLVFSNGNLDPWHGGGVLQNISDSIVAVIIDGGAHHLDLRGDHALDPPSVKFARGFEVNNIQKWIQQHKNEQRNIK